MHVFNNYYFNNEYGVASTCNAGVLVEGNYFENVDEPTLSATRTRPMAPSCSATTSSSAPARPRAVAARSTRIPYSYTLAAASTVKATVMAGAGTGRI